MKKYETPKMEVLEFETEDIITSSGIELPEDNFGFDRTISY